MTETMTEFEERVARGAALLDKAKPHWVDHIELDRFDITDPCSCVLGQVFEWYAAGCNYLGLTGSPVDPADAGERLFREQPAAHSLGFFENAHAYEGLDCETRRARWQELDRAWYALISERKAAA